MNGIVATVVSSRVVNITYLWLPQTWLFVNMRTDPNLLDICNWQIHIALSPLCSIVSKIATVELLCNVVACSVISLVDNRMLPWLSLVLCKF